MAWLNLTPHRRVRLPAGKGHGVNLKCQRPRKCAARDDTIPETKPHLRVLSGSNATTRASPRLRERLRMFPVFLIIESFANRGLVVIRSTKFTKRREAWP